jgi:hypothetical protein
MNRDSELSRHTETGEHNQDIKVTINVLVSAARLRELTGYRYDANII